MPEKSVRELSAHQRRHYALATRVFNAVLLGAVILGIVSLAIGMGLYTWALAGQCIGEGFGLARTTAMAVESLADAEQLADSVMDIYDSLSDEQRSQTGTAEYRAVFADIRSSRDYGVIRDILVNFMSTADVADLYFAAYDRENSAIVYFTDPDPDPELVCMPGDWDPVNTKDMEKFLNWDGTGKLYAFDNTETYGFLCTAAVPLKNADDNIYGFILCDINANNISHGLKNFFIQYTIAMLIVVSAFGLILSSRIKKKVVNPINDISDAAQEYVNDKRSGSDASDHFSGLDIHTGDEIENLKLIMADMERELSDYEDDLTRVTSENERISTELSLATRIQADMLPSIYPAFPERPEFDICANMTPAKEVGGDFYDFFLIDDDHLGILQI